MLLGTDVLKYPSDYDEMEVDEQVNTLSRVIVEANDECFRRVGLSSRRKVFWWTNDLSRKRGRLRTLIRNSNGQ